MKFSSAITLGLLSAIAPTLAIPPEDFGFPSAPNDTALTVAFTNDGTTTVVQEGELFGAGITAQPPTIALNTAMFQSLSTYDGAYFLLMVDPDASYPQSPTERFFLHWAQPNLTRCSTCPLPSAISSQVSLTNTTAPFVPFTRPAPPTNSSAHRYILYAFAQASNFTIPSAYASYSASNRSHFNLTSFISDANLGTPAAAQYFFVSNQTQVPQTFTSAGATATYPGGNGEAVTSGTGPASSATATATGTVTSSSGGGGSSSGASATATAGVGATGAGGLVGVVEIGLLGLAALL